MDNNGNSASQYLIAANSKRAQLIFNVFRPIDLGIEIGGIIITIILFLALEPSSLLSAIITLAPVMITTFLVLPIPNYQNVMCIIKNIYVFLFVERQHFRWKGWCAKDEFKGQ